MVASFNCQLDNLESPRRAVPIRGCLVWPVSIFVRVILITLRWEELPTVGVTIPWAGDPGIYRSRDSKLSKRKCAFIALFLIMGVM